MKEMQSERSASEGKLEQQRKVCCTTTLKTIHSLNIHIDYILYICEYVHTYMLYIASRYTLRSLLFKGTNFCVFCKNSQNLKTAKFTPHAQVAQRYIPCARSERASA